MRIARPLAVAGALTAVLITAVTVDACWRRRCCCPPPCQPVCVPVEPAKPPNPQKPGYATRLNAVIIVDDRDPKLGLLFDLSARRVEDALKTQLGDDRVVILPIRASQASNGVYLSSSEVADKVKDALKDVKKDESVLCYYAGHGESDQKDHFLNLTGTRKGVKKDLMNREDLFKVVEATPAQLKVMMTDACALLIRPLREREAPSTVGGAGAAEIPLKKTAAYESLFLGHAGELDVNSSTPPRESAYYVTDLGGLFTSNLVDASEEEGLSAWEDALNYIKDQTNEDYHKLRSKMISSSEASLAEQKAFKKQLDQTIDVFKNTVKPAAPEEKPTAEAAAEAGPPRPARILVRVPADVRIYINGEPTRQASEERLFISPPLPPGRTLGYDLRLETTREGKLLTRTERVEVRAGETTEVNLEAPTAEAAAARTPPAAAAASAGGDE